MTVCLSMYLRGILLQIAGRLLLHLDLFPLKVFRCLPKLALRKNKMCLAQHSLHTVLPIQTQK